MSPYDSIILLHDLQLWVAMGHTSFMRSPGGDRGGSTPALTLAGEEESKE